MPGTPFISHSIIRPVYCYLLLSSTCTCLLSNRDMKDCIQEHNLWTIQIVTLRRSIHPSIGTIGEYRGNASRVAGMGI